MKKPTTRRGAETRAHILATAADLIHQRGVAATSIDDILEASGTGKSQLYHYFEDKHALVREVVRHNLEVIVAAQGSHLENLSSWEGIETWLDSIATAHEDSGLVGGCRLGSLAAEVADRDELLRLDLVDALSTWESYLGTGLRELKAQGALRPDADPLALAETTIAIIQGGYLLATTKKDVRPMRNALAAASVHLRSFAVPSEEPRRERRRGRASEGRG